MEEAIEEKSLTQIQYEKVLKELEAHNENGKLKTGAEYDK